MPGSFRLPPVKHLCTSLVLLVGLLGCSASRPPSRPATSAPTAPVTAPPTAPATSTPTPPGAAAEKIPAVTQAVAASTPVFPVMLGIDVLESQGFAAVKGKRLGLLTHPAGVNRRGESTIDVLRRAPGVKLVALYAVEHGIYNEQPAEKYFPDRIDSRTSLPVYSLYSGRTQNFVPTRAQLKGIDALVIDLQDIGVRSYTFSGAMKTAMRACFENGKEVIVLDRPNPLGGLKVSGPPLDAGLMSDVGRFRVPYVHGLTIGELAQMAKQAPGVLGVSDAVRDRGKLTVVPMRGWRRSMRWPETGLTFVPTSTYVQDFAACQGYAMTGLGCILGGFTHGVGKQYPFRGISHQTAKIDIVEKELRALDLPGIKFRRVSAPDRKGNPAVGLYTEIIDYDDWQPAELSFYLMKLACKLEKKNPFAAAMGKPERRTFLVHVGSEAFFNDLASKGAAIDIEAWLRTWREQAHIYQEQSKRYWLYR
ncbi:MAG: hypothetical protein JWM32_152 [Verrucomicrobia bacterium]|nr:hypothetical protein [Verrucomicrobiota bacterium]